MSEVCPPVVANISTTYGSALVGSFLSAALWGASSLQAFIYFLNSADSDPAYMRLMVSCLWLLDTVNEILLLKSNWPVLVLQYGRLAGLADIQPELMHHTWIEAIVILVVQMYFIRRIYIFPKTAFRGRSIPVLLFTGTLSLLAVWQLIGVIVYQIFGYGQVLAVLSTHREVGINLSLRAAAVVVDVSVAIAMIYLIQHQAKATQLKKTKRMISRLVMVTISSGALTAVMVTIVLIMLALFPDTMYYCMFEYLLCSLYFSTLLTNLNTREFIRGQDEINTFSGIPGIATTVTTSRTRTTGDTLILRGMSQPKSSVPASDMFIKVQRERDVEMMDESDSYKQSKV